MLRVRFGTLSAAMVLLVLLLAPAMGHTKEDPALYPLVYGATEIQIGWVKVYNDFQALHVEFEITEPGWSIEETHLLVTLESITWTGSGDYPPGSYTYQHSFSLPYPSADSYDIVEVGSGQFGEDPPKFAFSAILADTPIYLIAHAALVGPQGQLETAFGGGFRNANTVLVYRVQREDGRPPTVPLLPVFALPVGVFSLWVLLRRHRE